MNVVMAYVGDDPDMIKELQLLVAEQTRGANQWQLKTFAPTGFSFHQLISVKDLRLVIYDFTQDVVLSDKFCLQMQLFRSQIPWRYVPVMGVYSSAEQLEMNRFVFTLGLSYAHIKGADISVFKSDCAWIITGNEAHLGDYATCKDLLLPHYIEALSAMVELSAEKLVIDTDIFTDKLTQIKCLAFGEQIPHGFELIDSAECGRWSDTFYKIDYSILYPGPWDEVNDKTLLQDTLETWIVQNQTPPISSAFVFTKNNELIRDILCEPIVDKFNIFCSNSDERLAAKLVALAPQIICFEMESEQTSEQLLNTLAQALTMREDWKPFIILYNTTLTTDAARLSVRSERLLTYDKKLEFKTLKDLLLVSSRKQQVEVELPEVRLPWNSPQRLVSFQVPLTIQSLSEHEIRFYCLSEIPMFTVLRMQEPVVMYVMIIPAHKLIEREGLGILYRGVIHGLDHDSEAILRSYVNAIIFTPPKVFGILPQEFPNEDLQVVADEKKEDMVVVDQVQEINDLPSTEIRGRVRKGKSKL